MKSELTQKRLKEKLHYNPKTGVFTFTHRVLSQNRKSRLGGRFAGWLANTGYLSIGIGNKHYLLHRLAWLYMEGYFPEGEIDHKDKEKLNNKWDNLREVSHQCNSRNCKISKNNTSGITGVVREKRKKKVVWRACISVDGKNISMLCPTKISAVRQRLTLEKKYNFIGCDSTSASYLYLKKKGLL